MAAILFLSVTLVTGAVIYLASQVASSVPYENLKRDYGITDNASQSVASTVPEHQAGINSVFSDYPDAAAWIQVANTSINYPVVQASKDAPDYYLDHNLFGETSSAGCLFIDKRATNQSSHIAVYGHHMGYLGSMFSPLRTAWQEDAFLKLGNLSWARPATSGSVTTIYKPLCALKLDKSNQLFQTFDFEDNKALRVWLHKIMDMASIQTKDATKLVNGASRVISLVTCSELRSGQNGRSVVIYVS